MPLPPSSMVRRYTSIWGESLQQIAAANGVPPGSIKWASGLDPSWHHLTPLPPGTVLLIPLHPIPHRVMVASAPAGTDPRGKLVHPDAGTVIQTRTQTLPMPIGI